MKLAVLCLCLASTACAVPVSYVRLFLLSLHMLHFSFFEMALLPWLSVMLTVRMFVYFSKIYPHTFGAAGGANPAQPFPSYGFIKYSIPQPPGRQSVEVIFIVLILRFFFLFSHEVLLFLFQIPTFDANALPSQDPPQPLQQDQPTQTSQVTTNLYVIIKHESALRV
uniref:Secretory calcium-binding phosphoprotein 5 n=1 Tax=Amphiprion percula TaxID=161767 RepID=A0A3P8TN18_AMPPE